MKYKLVKTLIEELKTYEELDDLIIFKKPYAKNMTFQMKDGTERFMNLKDYSYISLSNHGFLFIQKESHRHITIPLNNVKDMTVK